MEFLRAELKSKGFITAEELCKRREGETVKLAGSVIRPHRPPTRSGRIVVFLTLEDETGLADATIFENVYQRCGEDIFTQAALAVEGKVSHRSSVTVIAQTAGKL